MALKYFLLLHTNQDIQIKTLCCVFQWHQRSCFFSNIMFVISTCNENGKLSCIYSINSFLDCQSIKFEISSYTLQISLCGYSLVEQTDFRKVLFFFVIRTCYICCTFHTLLNKLPIRKWFWFFCSQICYHVTAFYNRVRLSFNFLKTILLRWLTSCSSAILPSWSILWYAETSCQICFI